MERTLLVTKLVVPPVRPGLVARPHLMERLGGGFSSSLILVSAPAGFGKTTLLSEWAHSSHLKEHTAWVSLDEADNDPVRFWDYFIAALQTLHPGCGDNILPWLHSSRPPSAESILTVVINDLSRVNKVDCVVVLDDYHLIVSKQIHDGITYLVEHLPDRVHLAIAARVDPPLPLARLRGKGMMLEIRTDDLRFTRDDAGSLLQALRAPEISANDIAALNDRTEGWAVGLKMAALSMRGQRDVSSFIAAFTGGQRYVMDYLIEEVLQKQSLEVRDFLLKTSILERLTGPLCDAVTERTGGHEMLLRLEKDNLFIVPLDEARQWYRYHHLFADLLRHRCETIYGKDRVAALHRPASEWYEDSGLHGDAIHHALAAHDWETSIRLLDAHWAAWWKRGEFKTLVGWFQPIPQEIIRGHLHLYSHYASVLTATGGLDAADTAISYLEAAAADDAALQGEVAFTRGMVMRHRGDQRCIELFEKAYVMLPLTDVAMRSSAAMNIAHVQQRYSNFGEAERWAMIACELGQRAGDVYSVIGAFGQIGIVNIYQGKLRRAVEMFRKANQLAEQAATALSFASYDMLCLSLYELHELEASAESARLVIERYESTGENAGMITGYFYLALICLTRGDSAAADALMEKLDKASHHPSVDSFWHATYIAQRVRYAIRRWNLEEAAKWGELLPDMAGMMLADRPVVARLLLAQGKREAAATLLGELYDSAVTLGAAVMVKWIRTYQALAASTEAAALEFLSEALTNAEPEGAIRVFVDEGELLRPLLEKAMSQGIMPTFTRKLLGIIDEEERLKPVSKGAMPPMPPSSPLSEREIEVMKLVAEGLSNQQIAARLSISLSTAKTHVYHIFDKLDAKDRLHAVGRARDLKLI